MGKTATKNDVGATRPPWTRTVGYIKHSVDAKFPDFDHCAVVVQENVLALRKYIPNKIFKKKSTYILKYLEAKDYDAHRLLSNRSEKISTYKQQVNVKWDKMLTMNQFLHGNHTTFLQIWNYITCVVKKKKDPDGKTRPLRSGLTCLSLTRRGPNTIHWMSLATNIRTQQAVLTRTCTQTKERKFISSCWKWKQPHNFVWRTQPSFLMTEPFQFSASQERECSNVTSPKRTLSQGGVGGTRWQGERCRYRPSSRPTFPLTLNRTVCKLCTVCKNACAL